MRCIQEISVRYLLGIRIAWMFARFFFHYKSFTVYKNRPRVSSPNACFNFSIVNARPGTLIFYGTTQFMVRFLPKFACYTSAQTFPTMGPVVSTSRSQLSVIASRKTRRRNFCKWSHSLSTAGLSAEWRAKRYATFTRQSEFIKSDDPVIHSPERERLKIQSV